MPGAGVEVRNIDQVQGALARLLSMLVDHEIDTALMQGGLIVEGEAKRKCPVDTGRLRGSIYTKIVNADKYRHEAHVGSNVEYAEYIEYGTGLMAENGDGKKTGWVREVYGKKHGGWYYTMGCPAKPYLRPAYISRREEVCRTIQTYIVELIWSKT